jgi:hypothetical protein
LENAVDSRKKKGYVIRLYLTNNIPLILSNISIIFGKQPSLTLASLSKKSTSSSIGIEELLSSMLNVRLLLEPFVLGVPKPCLVATRAYIPMTVPSFGERRVSALLIGYDPAFAENGLPLGSRPKRDYTRSSFPENPLEPNHLVHLSPKVYLLYHD